MNDTFTTIKKLSEKCYLHRLILDGLKGYHETSLIEVRRVGGTLKLNGEPMSGLSICKGLGMPFLVPKSSHLLILIFDSRKHEAASNH